MTLRSTRPCPPRAYTYAIPYEYYVNDHVRRYGFHGTSHSYVSKRAAKILGQPIETLKIVTCHLGNGSSVDAIAGGKSMETSMGFTPLDGLPMGTRCGSIDVSIIEYLMENHNMSIEDVMNVLNKKSGVLGVLACLPISAIWKRPLRKAMSAPLWPSICSATRPTSASAPLLPP